MSRTDRNEQPSDPVMRDLVHTLIQENLREFTDRAQPDPPIALTGETMHPGERWCRIDLAGLAGAWVCFRARPAAALQPYRLSRPPVWHGASRDDQLRRLEPDELLELLTSARQGLAGQLPRADLPHARQVGADLRTAVQHAAVILDGRARLTGARPRPGELITAERLAATRNRPFHPTARAATGWTAKELARYGPMRQQPLGLDWVAPVIGPAGFGATDAVEFFRRLAEAFCEMGLGFLRYGVVGFPGQPVRHRGRAGAALRHWRARAVGHAAGGGRRYSRPSHAAQRGR